MMKSLMTVATIKILVEGYAREIESGWLVTSTAVLVESSGKRVVVDPGCARDKLMLALQKQGLTANDIDFVFLTHNHTDHTLLAGIFNRAKVLTTSEIYDSDRQVEHNDVIPGTELKIIKTPGHCFPHCSLLVNTAGGVYLVAGDVFWWQEGQEQKIDKQSLLDHGDPYARDKQALKKNREKVLKLADYVIPGHGKMFKNER